MSYYGLKKQFLKFFFILSITVVVQSFFSICFASGILSRNSYSLPVGKDVLVAPSSKFDSNLAWKSDNTSVATVNSFGIVHANAVGSAKIIVTNKHTKKDCVCTVTVTESEPFKNVITSSNMASVNESFEIKAFANKKVEEVKFDICAAGYRKTFTCTKKSNRSDCCVWVLPISIPKCGNCKIQAWGKIKGSWKNCSEGNCEVYICDKNKRILPDFSEKRASTKASHFIMSCEGFVPRVYRDLCDVLTIGCGKRIYPFEPFYNNLSREEGIALFLKTLNQGSFTVVLNRFLKNHKIKCNQHQFDALISFCYSSGCAWMSNNSNLSRILLNCGCGHGKKYATVNSDNGLFMRSESNTRSRKLCIMSNNTRLELLNANPQNGNWYHVRNSNGHSGYCCGDYLNFHYEKFGEKNFNNVNKNKFIKEFSQYHHACKKCCKGLLRRRFEELDIFFRGIYSRNTGWRGAGNYPIPKCAEKLF